MTETEKTRKILKSQEGREFVRQVADIYGESFVGLWLFEVMGRQWDDLQTWCKEITQQITPETATWALDLWEDAYGIARDPAMGTEQRRARIYSRMRDRAPMNPYTLGRIASTAAAGASASIEELTGPNAFTVWISALPSTADEKKIRAAVERAKPAHLNFDVKYEQFDTGAIYTAGALQMSYDITIRQV